MSLGLGHKYWVRLKKYTYGTIEECIKFMKENTPSSPLEWFELHPQVKVIKDKQTSCDYYRVDLVEDAK